MSEAVPTVNQEFWRPPVVSSQASSAEPASQPNSCSGCGAEFMVESHFCYRCGKARGVRRAGTSSPDYFGFLRVLEFQQIKRNLGLSIPCLIAFLAGAGCLLGAICVGTVVSSQSPADFEAVQFFRIEWLLASVAAFCAGILLQCSASRK